VIVAFFCMGEPGHVQRMRAVVASVSAAGEEALVFTDRRFRRAFESAGGTFVDLFDGRPLDDESLPVPCRFVTFAGVHAGALVRALLEKRPSIVVHDTFAVVGKVVARGLGVPAVNVCAGHDVNPTAFVEKLRNDPRVRITDACRRAVSRLRDEHGWEDASPFSYVAATSRSLNLYGEPPEFLDEERRAAFEPLAFFGSLESVPAPAARNGGPLRVYVSFGTVVWRYFAEEAMDAISAIVAELGGRDGVAVRIALGGTGIEGSALRAPNVRVDDYVDQRAVLRESDVFVTHQGLNSTHEAVAAGVPMVSRPFFWDQPALAAKCAELGIAAPLRGSVLAAFEALSGNGVRERLAEARRWEQRVIAGRPAVVRRMLALTMEA